MKYQCQNPECKKTFTHPAKMTDYNLITKGNVPDKDFSIPSSMIEAYGCPFCKKLEFSEFIELSPAEASLEDMLQVPFEQVKEYIAKGYVELDRKDHVYAKGIVMLKTKEVKA